MDNTLRMALSLICTVTLLALAGGGFRMSAKRRDQYRSPEPDQGPDHLALIGQAARLLVGRWWIMAVPAAAAVIVWAMMERQMMIALGQGWSGFPPDPRTLAVTILDLILSSVNSSLKAPMSAWAWAVPFDGLVLIPVPIYAVIRYFQQQQTNPASLSGADENTATAFIAVSLIALVLIGVSQLLFKVNVISQYSDLFIYTTLFCDRTGTWLIHATAYSVWLGWVIHYAAPPEPDADGFTPSPLVPVLRVFPIMLVINLGLGIINRVIGGILGDWASMARLDVILVWAAFPLPFVMARRPVSLADAPALLGRLWTGQFSLLLRAALVATTFTALVTALTWNLPPLIAGPDSAGIWLHALINLPFAVLRAVSSVMILLYLVRVFARPDFDPPPA